MGTDLERDAILKVWKYQIVFEDSVIGLVIGSGITHGSSVDCPFNPSSLSMAPSALSNYWYLFKRHSMTVLVPALVAYSIYADYTNTQNFKKKKAELDNIFGEKN